MDEKKATPPHGDKLEKAMEHIAETNLPKDNKPIVDGAEENGETTNDRSVPGRVLDK